MIYRAETWGMGLRRASLYVMETKCVSSVCGVTRMEKSEEWRRETQGWSEMKKNQ